MFIQANCHSVTMYPCMHVYKHILYSFSLLVRLCSCMTFVTDVKEFYLVKEMVAALCRVAIAFLLLFSDCLSVVSVCSLSPSPISSPAVSPIVGRH